MPSGGFVQSNLISDVPGLAQIADPNLINPWGIAFGSTGPLWFADNNSGMLGAETSGMLSPAITVPGTAAGAGSPTGAVFNGGSGFVVSEAGRSGASVFLLATEDGTILGWNPDVDASHAIVAVDKSAAAGAGPVYTGLTIINGPGGSFLLAANFRAGTIDVFDQNFHQIQRPGEFTDPNLPAGYVPFNVQSIGGALYVTYVRQNGGRYDSGSGAGNGYVDVFDSHGALLQRLTSQGPLNSPWGVALAPANFGRFSNDLLVGNFGDGRINAFDPHTGAFLGSLTDAAGQPISIPDLWALSFGNDGAGGPAVLYFTAGIGHEQHGLFGSLQLSSAGVPGTSAAEKAIFDAIISSSQGVDDYPLPPSQGPSLQQNVLSAPPAVLVSLSSSSPALVPTLLAQSTVSIGTSAPGFFGGPSATGSVQFLPGGGSLLIVPLESHAPEPAFDSVTALGVRPGFGEPVWTMGQSVQLVAGAELDAAFENEFAVGDTTVTGALTSMGGTPAVSNNQNRLEPMVANRDESQAVNMASALNYLLMFLLAGCACHFAGVKDRLPTRLAFTVVTTLWCRITKRGTGTDCTANEKTQEVEWSTPLIADCGF